MAPEYPSGSKGHPTNLTAVEDLMVTMACCRASEDPISGANTEGTHLQITEICPIHNKE